MGIRKGTGNRSLDDFVRLACSADPEEPVHRPRRLAIAPRAAVVVGCVLLILAAVLALRAVLASTGAGGEAAPAAAARASASSIRSSAAGPVTAPATGPGGPTAAGPSGGAGAVVVHVTGAVTRPGVVTLETGSRVTDAINAVGGAAPDADTEQLNLARALTDGERIRVPRIGEVLPEPAPQPTGPAGAQTGTDTGGTGGGSASGTVNINTASVSELEKLPGIGPGLAQRIVEYRESHGPFASVDALTDVPGIGKAKLEALREQATI